MLRRVVSTLSRSCPACSKPNTASVTACTKCSTPLDGIPLEETAGTAFDALLRALDALDPPSAAFPRAVEGHTVRRVSADAVVFDDKYKIAPEHVLAVPRRRPDLEDAGRLGRADAPLVRHLWREAHAAMAGRGRGPLLSGFNLPVSVPLLHLHMVRAEGLAHTRCFEAPRFVPTAQALHSLAATGRVQPLAGPDDIYHAENVAVWSREKASQ